jgi:hypothetical protein
VAGVSFRGVENLAPGSGDNVFRSANGVGVRGRVDGGSDRYALDCAAYAPPVKVNPRLGKRPRRGRGPVLRMSHRGAAADLAVGFANFQGFFGNGGRDLLIGSHWVQVLNGGAGMTC